MVISMETYVVEAGLEIIKLAFLNHQVILIVQVLHNIVVVLLVIFEDQRFDRGIALDKQTW